LFDNQRAVGEKVRGTMGLGPIGRCFLPRHAMIGSQQRATLASGVVAECGKGRRFLVCQQVSTRTSRVETMTLLLKRLASTRLH
jgi:hypothetical protein